MKVAFFSTKPHDREFFNLVKLPNDIQFTYFEVLLSEETVLLAKGFDAICLFVNDKATAACLEVLAQYGVKLIVLRCAGFNNIDAKAAALHGICVLRVPAYSPEAIAEHAFALIMTLNRKTHKAYNRIRENNFSVEKLEGFNLHKKTVGVIGTGKTGAAFCKIAFGFGCSVIAFDLLEDESLKALGVEYLSMENLFSRADIISLHCPLNASTHHMIDAAAFLKMKDAVMLINTSRGGVMDTQAAIESLKTGKLGFLGMDVYEQEETLFSRDLSDTYVADETISRLMSFPNVLITAHQGFFTKEALEQIALTTVENIVAFKNGAPLFNAIPNPSK